jgi:hypothetical protein
VRIERMHRAMERILSCYRAVPEMQWTTWQLLTTAKRYRREGRTESVYEEDENVKKNVDQKCPLSTQCVNIAKIMFRDHRLYRYSATHGRLSVFFDRPPAIGFIFSLHISSLRGCPTKLDHSPQLLGSRLQHHTSFDIDGGVEVSVREPHAFPASG